MAAKPFKVSRTNRRIGPRRSRALTPAEIQEACELHEDGAALKTIARRLHRSDEDVRAALLAAGRKMRNRGQRTNWQNVERSKLLVKTPIGELAANDVVAVADLASMRGRAWIARIDARVDADGIPLCRRWM